jgi:formylmethanofuran dehydrogenase subunit B
MNRAWIDGRPAALDAAIEQAARLLQASRLPVLAGLDCDVAGARAAIALARRLGAVCDQMDARVMLHTLDAMREAGAIVTTPDEARLRADTVLMVGSSMGVDWPDIAERLMPLEPEGEAKQRGMWWLCPDDRRRTGDTARRHARVLGRSNDELPALLAALRARAAGRPIRHKSFPTPSRRAQGRAGEGETRRSKQGASVEDIDALAAGLKAAKFGVAVWAAGDLDALATEMLFGLIDDLNAHTRFAGVPLPRNDRSPGVMQACGWLTGFPCPVGFGRPEPEHDPWRFDAQRLIEGRLRGVDFAARLARAVATVRPVHRDRSPPPARRGADAYGGARAYQRRLSGRRP